MVGHYKPLSKFVICAMMIRGRHRGLPYALDRAINLPVDTANVPLHLSEPEEKALKAA
jgi:Trk-type K+ transport system membrane component